MQLSILKIIPFCIVFFVYFSYIKNANGKESNLKIVEIRLDDEKILWSSLAEYDHLNYTKLNNLGIPQNLILYWDVHSISFNFHFKVEKETKFRYKLTGCENHWNYLDSCQWIRYVNLKHGKYTFQLQALVNNTIVEESKFDFSKNLNKKYLSADFLMLFTTFLLILVTIKMK